MCKIAHSDDEAYTSDCEISGYLEIWISSSIQSRLTRCFCDLTRRRRPAACLSNLGKFGVTGHATPPVTRVPKIDERIWLGERRARMPAKTSSAGPKPPKSKSGPKSSKGKAKANDGDIQDSEANGITPQETTWSWTTLAESAMSKHPAVFTKDARYHLPSSSISTNPGSKLLSGTFFT